MGFGKKKYFFVWYLKNHYICTRFFIRKNDGFSVKNIEVMKRIFTVFGASFTSLISKAISALQKHAISLYITPPPNLLLFNELHIFQFIKPSMSNQTIYRLLGIFADDGCLARRMVFVQDELGALKPCKRHSGNCRCVDHI